jgi:hypothetical protein
MPQRDANPVFADLLVGQGYRGAVALLMARRMDGGREQGALVL